MSAVANQISATLRERNRIEDVLLSQHTTLRVGGPASLFTLLEAADLPAVVALPHRWLGKGANLLVGDAGVPELVIKLGEPFNAIELGRVQGDVAKVYAGAAADLAKLVGACAKAGLAGPEGLAGVPATVGGALWMNAGTAHCWMLDWVTRAQVLLPGENTVRWIERSEIPASYRSCGLPMGTVFLACEMHLRPGDSAALRARASELKQLKAATQPLAQRSAGCSFKNPSPEIPAGRLIDELGLKGERRGQAVVSPIHANFIVNEGGATAADVCELIRHIRDVAWRERGIVLQLEVQTWNCDERIHQHPSEVAA